METINPQYEVLFSDLKNQHIGNYLASREFKLFMTDKEYYNNWKEIYEEVKSQRSYYSFGTDHEPGDATNTFVYYLNSITENEAVENLVVEIISRFVEFKKEKSNFSDILQSMKIARFSTENLEIIKKSIENHDSKEFPSIEPKHVKSKASKESNSVNSPNFKDIFIVHGHNDEIKHSVARLLDKLKLNPIILNEQSDEGLTIIEKFEKHSNVSFAVVLLTWDDYGSTKSSEKHNKRARQNVILELGYFIAKLGRKNVLPLYESEVELPSDISGVLYTKIDDSENWKFRVVKELKTAGFNVDANDIL